MALIAGCSGAAAPTSLPAASIAPSPFEATSPVATASVPPSASPNTSAATSPKAKPSLDIDLADIGEYLTAGITLLDLADTDLAVTVTYIDPESGDSAGLGTYTLGSMDQMTDSVPPGTYRLDFRQPADSAAGPSCTIEIADADGYVFAAVHDAVAISRAGFTPTDARELLVATSSLCKG